MFSYCHLLQDICSESNATYLFPWKLKHIRGAKQHRRIEYVFSYITVFPTVTSRIFVLKIMLPIYFHGNYNRYREHNTTVRKFSAIKKKLVTSVGYANVVLSISFQTFFVQAFKILVDS